MGVTEPVTEPATEAVTAPATEAGAKAGTTSGTGDSAGMPRGGPYPGAPVTPTPAMEGPGSWTDPLAARTMPQFVRAAAHAYGDAVAIRLEGAEGERGAATYRELDERSARLGRALLARGVGKGSRVGFIYCNGPEFAVAFAAIGRIGAVAVPISTMLKANELVRVLRQSDVGLLLCQRTHLGHDLAQRLGEALPGLAASGPDLRLAQVPFLRRIWSTGPDLPSGIADIAELLGDADRFADDLLRELETEVHPADQLYEIYTSGSMALPKGVVHLHGPTLFRTHWIAGHMAHNFLPETPVTMPMFWVGGMMFGLMPFLERGITALCTEGTPTNSRHALGSMLSPEDIAEMLRNPPHWSMGMSETLAAYAWGDEVRAPGRPLAVPMDHFAPGYDVRIADEQGREVGDGETGEIQVRGYPVTPALHKIERHELFTPDGFYHTGDLAERDGSRVHFVGRGGDMIKTAGANVSPAEVEEELQRLPGVHSAYVVGLPDDARGQLVAAALVARAGATLDMAAIEAEMRRSLSTYKVPRIYLEILREDVPMLHSNKVSRRQLVELMAQRLGRPAG